MPPQPTRNESILELQHFSGYRQAGNKKCPGGTAEEMGER
jgi:hypothetical protein